MRSTLGKRLASNLQILASLLKEAGPRKPQPELAGYSGEGSRRRERTAWCCIRRQQ